MLKKGVDLPEWTLVERFFSGLTGKTPDIRSMLYLVGLQEIGQPMRPLSKEEKIEAVHVGTCAVLAHGGFYAFTYRDEDGWPHYKPAAAPPLMTEAEQEQWLKDHLALYLKAEGLLEGIEA